MGRREPGYGIDTRVLDKIMQQHKPMLPSEEQAEDEPFVYDPLGMVEPLPDDPKPTMEQPALPGMNQGDGPDVPPPSSGGGGIDPSLVAALAKSGAQMGTLGGKASDTSAVSNYANILEKRKMIKNNRRDKMMARGGGDSGMEKLRMRLAAAKQAREEKRKNQLTDIENRTFLDKRKRDESRAFARSEEDRLWEVPGVGVGRTLKDSTDVKSGTIAKKKFDSQLDEMIALRKKHEGGNITNRADVARGKQLSKDLLLSYKNMAKLGVLSKSDENIINTIIPKDPLAYSASDFGLGGNDAILHKLNQFKRTSDKDYITTIGLRVKDINPEVLKDYENREQLFVDMETPKVPGSGLMDEETAIAGEGFDAADAEAEWESMSDEEKMRY